MEKLKLPTDQELIQDVKENGSSKSFILLSERHSNLYYKICQKYTAAFMASGIPPEDVFAEKDYTLYRSVITFNPDKGAKYSTWLGNYTKYSCLNFLKKNSKQANFKSDEQTQFFLDKQYIENQPTDYSGFREHVFSIIEKMKDKRIKQIFELRYDPKEQKKMTWKNIAKKLEISAQTAINLHSKGIKLISKKIDSE